MMRQRNCSAQNVGQASGLPVTRASGPALRCPEEQGASDSLNRQTGDPMPLGNPLESQRDSAPKPKVASRELPWEKRVVSANPNGVEARWRRGGTIVGVENRTDANPG